MTILMTPILRVAESHNGLPEFFENGDKSRVEVCQTIGWESGVREGPKGLAARSDSKELTHFGDLLGS